MIEHLPRHLAFELRRHATLLAGFEMPLHELGIGSIERAIHVPRDERFDMLVAGNRRHSVESHHATPDE